MKINCLAFWQTADLFLRLGDKIIRAPKHCDIIMKIYVQWFKVSYRFYDIINRGSIRSESYQFLNK